MLIKTPHGWELPERDAAPEGVFRAPHRRQGFGGQARRRFLKYAGFAGLAGAATAWGMTQRGVKVIAPEDFPEYAPMPAPRNGKYTVDRPVPVDELVSFYNNFYEFTTDKGRVWRLAKDFPSRPWRIRVTGHVEKELEIDVDDLIKKFSLEERVYRHRCVEAWSVVVPWTGFPLADLVKWAKPTARAKYLKMVSFNDPENAPGQKEQDWYPWPYFEGLTMAEATNELALLVVGSYGHILPNQNGAPIRVHLPWKYGFKSIKSIVKFEFTTRKPATFWNKLAPKEYDFTANVDPSVPHPRWSQATETDIATGNRIPTLPYNGYAEYVGHLYGEKKKQGPKRG